MKIPHIFSKLQGDGSPTTPPLDTCALVLCLLKTSITETIFMHVVLCEQIYRFFAATLNNYWHVYGLITSSPKYLAYTLLIGLLSLLITMYSWHTGRFPFLPLVFYNIAGSFVDSLLTQYLWIVRKEAPNFTAKAMVNALSVFEQVIMVLALYRHLKNFVQEICIIILGVSRVGVRKHRHLVQ